MRDNNNWDLEVANLRGKTLNFNSFIPWDDYSSEIKFILLKSISKSGDFDLFTNDFDSLSTISSEKFNENLFSYNPALWFYFAVDNSGFSEEMITLQYKLLDILQKCLDTEVSDLRAPTISNMTLKGL